MRLEIKKLDLRINVGVKGKGGGTFEFNLEDYKQEMTLEEMVEYLKLFEILIKEVLKELTKD